MALGNVIREFIVKATLNYDDKSFAKLDGAVGKTAQSAKQLSIAIAGASAAVFGLAKVTSDNARQLDNYSKQLGINTDRLQELSFAAEEAAGVSRDELVGALEGVAATLDDVRKGNINASSGYARLGLANELIADRTLKADQVLAKVADRLRKVRDPIQKAAIAQELFGGAGAKLIPLLDQGSAGIARLGEEGRRLGAVLDQSAIAQGVEFQKTLTRLWTTIRNITYTIGTELFRALGPTFQEFQKFVLANRQFIATGIATFVKSLGTFLLSVLKGVTLVAKRVEFLIKIFGGWETVTKAVAIGMAAIFGAKILAGIGSITIAVKGLATAFSLANVAAAALPLAVGAAVLFLIGLMEDLYVFFTGGDSLFGRLTGLKPQPIVDFFKGIGDAIATYFLAPLEAALSFIAKLANFTTGGIFEGKNPLDFASGAIGSIKDFLSMGPSTGAAAASSVSNQSNRINAPITVMVPPGTSASEATKIVSDGTSQGFKEALRQTANANSGGVAY